MTMALKIILMTVFYIIMVVVVFPIQVVKFILLRLTFAKCGNCCHFRSNYREYWWGECQHPDNDKRDNHTYHTCNPACRRFSLFSFKNTFGKIVDNIIRYVECR